MNANVMKANTNGMARVGFLVGDGWRKMEEMIRLKLMMEYIS
jgi:hypothetical protein